MRRKTNPKRQSILDAAVELFLEKGFAKTTMGEINVKAGCSKRTLYSYFSSKDELFVESVISHLEEYLKDIASTLYDPQADLKTVLHKLVGDSLRIGYSPGMVAFRRMAIAEAERSGIGILLFEKAKSWQAGIASFLAKAMDEGRLRHGDPLLAALHLRALQGAEFLEPCLLGVLQTPLDEAIITKAADRAVTAFLRIYAPD